MVLSDQNTLKVAYVDASRLKPFGSNARQHSDKQVEQIANSIQTFGWTIPILIDDDDVIIAGHGRLFAAQKLGMQKVPVIQRSGLTDPQIRALRLADNKLAENASWDAEFLRSELKFLDGFDLDFDIGVIGFETAEIDLVLLDNDDGATEPEAPELEPGPPVSRPGDLWKLGDHYLYCGDALDPDAYRCVLQAGIADAVFTDPPYNVPIDGNVMGKGKHRHGEFVMASGEMSDQAFEGFLGQSLRQMKANSRNGAVIYVCMDWRHSEAVLTSGRHADLSLLNLCVWNKTNGGMGSLYRSKHELVFVFKNGTAPHINNVDLGRHGRNRTNVWDYAGANAFSSSRDSDLAMHPTVKPVSMVADALLDVTNRGHLVLDPFCGSGTILLAAERTGRIAAAIELDPKYVDVAVQRFEQETGIEATEQSSGLTFNNLSQTRENPNLETSDDR